ncbi:AN1-type zinc finger protein [Haloarchaeobius sp. HRN-SO-5]|uniref:AN1-type zinc finger protein n=1 Tax=Haloarchaeobius sp. HRN-SO-5 TaxID=3446118 RepID=UPI003EBC03EA
MSSCAFCGQEVDGLPYTCNECGESHCGRHRLPERHECGGLDRVADRPSGQGTFIGTSSGGEDDSNVVANALDALLAPLRRLRR